MVSAPHPLILIVAERHEEHAWLAAYIRAAGYAVAASDDTDAARKIDHLHPEALLVDTGRRVAAGDARRVQALRPLTACPLLVVVDRDDQDTGPAALDAGADDFLRRPIVVQELRARLEAHLRPRPARGA